MTATLRGQFGAAGVQAAGSPARVHVGGPAVAALGLSSYGQSVG